ncbi:hypothetical protein HOLleu_23225 [Holothuria leucospilota]|uniref:Uncharacterized protein n=1 Tax=Holothuria leucospilota TaxID=206669 RepID=A0A9Q1H5H3_HOLLE|nr:hypothetical protein HOLleu_23225 [Holothuria leucospilota]
MRLPDPGELDSTIQIEGKRKHDVVPVASPRGFKGGQVLQLLHNALSVYGCNTTAVLPSLCSSVGILLEAMSIENAKFAVRVK